MPLLHKKVMALATIDSVATTKTLRSNLRELPTYCSTIKGDIKLLHSYFDANYTQIKAHEARISDPVNMLFSAYIVVPITDPGMDCFKLNCKIQHILMILCTTSQKCRPTHFRVCRSLKVYSLK